MGFTFEKISLGGAGALSITGYAGEVTDLVVPPLLHDLPVRAIGKSAFAGRRDLRRVQLPTGLQILGLFAFQNCENLRELSLSNTAEDYSDGVIRGLAGLERIVVRMDIPGSWVLVREMLRDVDSRLDFVIEDPAGNRELCLTFPEYVNEAREDTFARAIHFSIEGAGLAYRECVTRKGIDLAGYDRVFARLTPADFSAAASVAAGRLIAPGGLGQEARERYVRWLGENAEEALRLFVEKGDLDAVEVMCALPEADAEALRKNLPGAAGKPEIGAVLVRALGERMRRGERKQTLSLEDW